MFRLENPGKTLLIFSFPEEVSVPPVAGQIFLHYEMARL